MSSHDMSKTKDHIQDLIRFAKAVSGVSVATTTQSIDRYGKRVYVPTRVDFP